MATRRLLSGPKKLGECWIVQNRYAIAYSFPHIPVNESDLIISSIINLTFLLEKFGGPTQATMVFSLSTASLDVTLAS